MQNGEPHLTDFGLARLVEAESTVTRTLEVLGTPSYMAPEQAAGETRKTQQGHGCLWTWRGALPTADWPSAFCWRNNLRDDQATAGHRAAATAPVESKNRSRSFHDLSEVPRERSKAPLLFRSRAGRRPGTLAKARANPGKAKWIFHTGQQMGATESKPLPLLVTLLLALGSQSERGTFGNSELSAVR